MAALLVRPPADHADRREPPARAEPLEDIPPPGTQVAEHRTDVPGLLDGAGHRGHLARVSEQNRSDDSVTRDHELPVAQLLVVFARDNLVLIGARLELPDRRQLDPDDLEDGDRNRPGVLAQCSPDRTLPRDPALVHSGRPQPRGLSAELSSVAGSEYVLIGCPHVRVDDDPALRREARVTR